MNAFISILEELERRSHEWTLAEAKLAELLTLLIEQFEDENYQLKAATPIDVLHELMESNDLKQKDLVDIFGAESTVSAVLNGKRGTTREHIKRLSERFKVSPEVFSEYFKPYATKNPYCEFVLKSLKSTPRRCDAGNPCAGRWKKLQR